MRKIEGCYYFLFVFISLGFIGQKNPIIRSSGVEYPRHPDSFDVTQKINYKPT